MTTTVDALPAAVRTYLQDRVGPVTRVEPIAGGRNHHLAAVVYAGDEVLFLKGIHGDDCRAARQAVEAAVAPVVDGLAPMVRWHAPDIAGWNLLAVTALPDARHADLAPGSADLTLIAAALRTLAGRTTPAGVTTARIERRWAEHSEPDDARYLAGGHLLHTDLRPDNILISGGQAWIVDWSWPTLGAAWIDAACVAIWLVAAGHTPQQADEWLNDALDVAPTSPALAAFTAINARLWRRIADDDPQSWKQLLAAAAQQYNNANRYRHTA